MAGIVKPASKLKTPTKKLFSMTPSAKNRMRELMSNKKDTSIGIRIGLKKGGCNGFKYTMHYADKIGKFDEIVKDEDLTILVDLKASFAIVGTEMDYIKDKIKSEFVFVNPNVKGTCGCGESFNT